MGTLRTMLKFRNADSTKDINERLKNISQKGIATGGTLALVPTQLKIDVNPFTAIGLDGMATAHEGSPTRLDVTAGQTQRVFLRSIYRDAQPPTVQLQVLSEAAFLADPELANLITIARITLGGGATEVLGPDIDYTFQDKIDPIRYFFLRGTVANFASLPTNAGSTPSGAISVRVGDTWLAITDRAFYRWNGTTWDTVGVVSFGVTPVKVIAGAAPAEGVSPASARADHQHGMDNATNVAHGAMSSGSHLGHQATNYNGGMDALSLNDNGGLNFEVDPGGAFTLLDGEAKQTTLQQVVLTNNATNYVYYDNAGVLATSTVANTVLGISTRYCMAVVVTSGGVITQIHDIQRFVTFENAFPAFTIASQPGRGNFISIQSAVTWYRYHHAAGMKMNSEFLIVDNMTISVPIDFVGAHGIQLRSRRSSVSTAPAITWSHDGGAINLNGVISATFDGVHFHCTNSTGFNTAAFVDNGVTSNLITIKNCTTRALFGVSPERLVRFIEFTNFQNDHVIENNAIHVAQYGIRYGNGGTNIRVRNNLLTQNSIGGVFTFGLNAIWFQNNSSSEHIWITGNKCHDPTYADGNGFADSIYVGLASTTVVADNQIHYTLATNGSTHIQFWQCLKSSITNNIIMSSSGLATSGIFLGNSCQDCVVSDNDVLMTDTTATANKGISAQLIRGNITGNRVTCLSQQGQVIHVDTGSDNVAVTGNTCTGQNSPTSSTQNGIQVTGNRVAVTGNILYNCGGSAAAVGSGTAIVVNGGTHHSVVGNQIYSAGHGVYANVTGTVFDSNHIDCVSDAVHLTSGATRTVVNGNYINHTGTTSSVVILSGSNNRFTDNTVLTLTTAILLQTNSTDYNVSHNSFGDLSNGLVCSSAINSASGQNRGLIDGNTFNGNSTTLDIIVLGASAANIRVTNNIVGGACRRFVDVSSALNTVAIVGNHCNVSLAETFIRFANSTLGNYIDVSFNKLIVASISGSPTANTWGIMLGNNQFQNCVGNLMHCSGTAGSWAYAMRTDGTGNIRTAINDNVIEWGGISHASATFVGVSLETTAGNGTFNANVVRTSVTGGGHSQAVVIGGTTSFVCDGNRIYAAGFTSTRGILCGTTRTVITSNLLQGTGNEGKGIELNSAAGASVVNSNIAVLFDIGIDINGGAAGGMLLGNVTSGNNTGIVNTGGFATSGNVT